jgi:hypothetical protein
VPTLVEQGETWARIAGAEGGSPDAARTACALAADRAARPAVTGLAIIVVRGFDPVRLVGHLRLPGRDESGVLDRNHGPEGLSGYRPIDGVDVPKAAAYVLVDVDRGDEYRGIAPRDALADVVRRGRSPLTIEEGLAAVLVRPELLESNHCFSLAGSRRGDKRVPALWIAGHAAKLGWCWEGAPHTWLGLASVAGRVA